LATKNLLIRGGADFSGIQKEMAKTQKTMSGFQSNVSKIMKGIKITLAGLGAGKLIKDSLDSTSELEGAMMGLQSILEGQGRSFINANKFIQDYINDGLVPLTDAVTAYKNLAARGYDDEQIKNTMNRLKDAAAFGRQSGLSLGEAVKSATEGLKNENSVLVDNAGVTKNVAKMWDEYAKKLGKSRNDLTQQEKIQAEVNGIMQETQWQVGDAAKYTATYAGRVAALGKTLRDVKINLGNAFMPIANIVLPLLQTLANALVRITSIFAQFSQALFGKGQQQAQTKATSQQANAVSDLGDSYQDAGKAAKGALAGFDEVNNLADNSDSGGAGAGIDTSAIGAANEPMGINFETNAPEISAEIQAMAESVKAKIKGITDTINANKELIISAVGGIVGAFATFKALTFLSTIPEVITGIGVALSALLTPIGIASMVIGGLIASFIYLYQTNEDFRNNINAVWTDISNTLNSFVNDTLKPIFSYIINSFLAPIGVAFKTYILPVLADLFVGIGKILNDILKLLQSTLDNAWNIVKPGLDLIKKIVVDVLEIIKNLWDKYGNDLINNIRGFIQGAQETFQLIWDNIINPIIQPALEMLSWLWTEHLSKLVAQIGEFIMKCVNGALELYNGFIKPLIDYMIVDLGPKVAFVVNLLVDLFGSMVAGIADQIKALFKIFGGIVDFIVGVFTGNWKKAWEGVRDIFGGIFDSLVGLVKVPLNYIIDAINAVIRGLNSIHFSLPDWIPGVGGKSFGISIASIPKLAKGGITNGPTLAMIGDNPGGKEVVSPLDKLQDMIASAFGSAMMASNQFNSNNSNNKSDAIMQLDGTTFARLIRPYIQSELARMGVSVVTTT
jgi:phage-related protein